MHRDQEEPVGRETSLRGERTEHVDHTDLDLGTCHWATLALWSTSEWMRAVSARARNGLIR